MSLAVTFWEGWALTHTGPLIWGALVTLCVLAAAAYYRLTGGDGTPQAPRREARNRARGTRARRHAPASLCRRARAIRAWVTSWFWWLDSPAGWHPWQAARERLALRIHGITIDITGGRSPANVPGREEDGKDPQPQPAACTMGPRAAMQGEPSNPAGDLTPGAYEPTEAEDAYMREHHPAAMLTVGPPGHPETPPNTPEHPRTPANEPARLATGAERAAAAPWHAPEGDAPSPWEHQTQWFSLDAIDADIQARSAAGGDT